MVEIDCWQILYDFVVSGNCLSLVKNWSAILGLTFSITSVWSLSRFPDKNTFIPERESGWNHQWFHRVTSPFQPCLAGRFFGFGRFPCSEGEYFSLGDASFAWPFDSAQDNAKSAQVKTIYLAYASGIHPGYTHPGVRNSPSALNRKIVGRVLQD